MIYANKSILGASYTFYAYYYWSATETNSSYSWFVGFYIGTTYNTSKSDDFRVRCVRAI